MNNRIRDQMNSMDKRIKLWLPSEKKWLQLYEVNLFVTNI